MTLLHLSNQFLPLSPPLKAGTTTTAVSVSSSPMIIHKAASTTTTTGIPIVDIYQTIPANPANEGKQLSTFFNCHSDIPSRHYYLQCP